MNRSGLLSVVVAACSAYAQQAGPVFEAASVKANHSASNGMGGMIGIGRGGKLSMKNVPVHVLITMAYGIADYQLSRGPAWISTEGYDIEAKPQQAVDNETAKLMFQNMLAERFHLRIHHENATVTGFHLTVDKGGNKLQPSEAQGIGFRIQSMEEVQGPADMPMLARYLKAVVRAPVEDHTGLTGKYDIHMKWSRDDGAGMASAASNDSRSLTAVEPTVSIFTALKQQLGLSLEQVKVPIDVIVIDNVERPTEN